jgi:hypothetical protein
MPGAGQAQNAAVGGVHGGGGPAPVRARGVLQEVQALLVGFFTSLLPGAHFSCSAGECTCGSGWPAHVGHSHIPSPTVNIMHAQAGISTQRMQPHLPQHSKSRTGMRRAELHRRGMAGRTRTEQKSGIRVELIASGLTATHDVKPGCMLILLGLLEGFSQLRQGLMLIITGSHWWTQQDIGQKELVHSNATQLS